MDTLQCAVVLAKLERFEGEVEAAHRHRYALQRQLLDEKGIKRVIQQRTDRTSVFAQYTVLLRIRP
jgi:UDP-2-acetamido-2-deoxy-ribo-hexuluronate aminotransferase